MEENKQPLSFEEQFPGYPIKPVPRWAYLPGLLAGLFAFAAIGSLAVGTMYVLSDLTVPTPLMTGKTEPDIPETEEEMMKRVPFERLYEIGLNCVRFKDADCTKKVFSRILELKPSDHVAMGHYAAALSSLGEKSKALSFIDGFVEKNPTVNSDLLTIRKRIATTVDSAR